MTNCNNKTSLRLGRVLLTSLLLFVCTLTYSQTITIGGDIYGGGREGAVGTAKADNMNPDRQKVTLAENALADTAFSTNITINTGAIRTVFGGGQNGRTYGNTKVTIQGSHTEIGSTDLIGTTYGGIFGAGDGDSAYVFGHSHLFIEGGTIKQNVYGGGNKADLIGSSTVTLRGGTLNESLFGGARLANIYGFSFVNIDGQHAANDLIVKAVYGGNDIAGDINSSTKWTWTSSPILPSVLPYANSSAGNKNTFKSYNAFVFASPEKSGTSIFVGQVYGGGNGDYDYGDTYTRYDNVNDVYYYTVNALDTAFEDVTKPTVEKVYLELNGGTYGYVYGGGNAATVTKNVDICLNNQTPKDNIYAMNVQVLDSMGLNYDTSDTVYIVSGTGNNQTIKSKYQFDRVFGGNNKATMNLQPAWHITNASINNLYSGGNEGKMTYYKGLLLSLTSSGLTANNVYGGCRRADVDPDIASEGLDKIPVMSGTVDSVRYSFPADLSAHILITAGIINNVYGGNDISGKVKGGNGLDIRSSIKGDVYGGGNGSYAYTDNQQLKNHRIYKDFYYSVPEGKTSAQALNDFRPNAEQAWIHVSGDSLKTTVIGGSLYCGGNSATLDIDENDPKSVDKVAELNIGSYVIARNVFLGSNGENMIDDAMLALYHDEKVDGKTFSTLDMTNDFAEYIKGVSVGIRPKISFEQGYKENSTKIGSLFFGGNLGSVTASGTFDVELAQKVVIFEKLVAGCNNANYYNDTYQIKYNTGGITKAPAQGQPKIRMNLNKITLMPGKLEGGEVVLNEQGGRLVGGNIFGGCYTSGIINGDVEINLSSAAYADTAVFKNVTRETQLNDVMSSALSMFGGGYGDSAFIKGNTIIKISGTGRMLKVFGGGLQGPVNGNTAIYLTGGNVGKIYGGGFEGPIYGHTSVYLDGGTVHSAFAGSCNADIRDYAEIFVGSKQSQYLTTVQNSIYGGNDFGGTIKGTKDFSESTYVSNDEIQMAYNPARRNLNVREASSYVEYVQGIITNNIFGGSCGSYDYKNSAYAGHITVGDTLPHLESAFVHFKGNSNTRNAVKQVFGAGEGAEGSDASANVQDRMQQRSYVLVNSTNDSIFKMTDVFGAGAFSGLGMQITQDTRDSLILEQHSAIVDLMGGWIHDAYGASYNEGVTRRTVVNVPAGSTAKMEDLFGGGYGSKLTSPCDTYESHVYWNSDDARVGYIYGGNNNCRRTLYTFVNINAEAWSDKNTGYLTTVYGAGCGSNTWAEYTYVSLNEGALVYEVYGGGWGGKVLNLESVNAWAAKDNTLYTVIGSGYEDLGFNDPLVAVNMLGTKTNTNVFINKGAEVGYRSDRRADGQYPVTIAGGYGYAGGYGDKYTFNPEIGSVSGTTYIGLHGGIVWKDMYAGGTLGGVYDLFKTKKFVAQSNAYVEGGSVRNVYGAGWKGRIGYTELPVTVTGKTKEQIAAIVANDIPGIANVVVGIPEWREYMYDDWGFYRGLPTVERNAYSSGEDGGAVIGTANLTVYNGYIGYRYSAIDSASNYTGYRYTPVIDDLTYVEKTYDETWTHDKDHPKASDGIDRLVDSGNAFGGGYTDNATADSTNVTIWGGHIRNSVYGGGEVAAIGRGEALQTEGSAIRQLKGIYKAGVSKVTVYSGNINRNVFGGGKGYNNNGTKGALLTDGYVFGRTEVNIHGGEIGTELTVLEGDGNVFGGGNIGYVFNSLESKRDTTDGYYYKIDANGNFITDNGEKHLSEDCRVIVTPYSKVMSQSVKLATPDGTDSTIFSQYSFVPTEYLNRIEKTDTLIWYNSREKTGALDQTGITIHNAIFAGGNVSAGNELYANTKTVFGNATATINDLYYVDLITVGTEHIGGLYGDGNLTRVDGYRELNITNYGTDYYGMHTNQVTLDEYHKMSDRERAYFQLNYYSKKAFTWNGTTYNPGMKCSKDELKEQFPNGAFDENNNNHAVVSADGTPDSLYWDEYGFVNIYAGRLINTIQRADFVGIFGSRMVMQGARDRVPETVDFTDYTINRVGEVSLNRVQNPKGSIDDKTHQIQENGNYFGIYNIVNHLAALTSDIDLYEGIRTTNKVDSIYQPVDSIPSQKTYFGWKQANKLNRRRNDGKAANKVALASGVYLEITTEESTQDSTIWGLITGVLELDLINVMPGLGGGYVYAKNEHGERDTTGLKHITLSSYNKNAVSNKQFYYKDTESDDEFQTSGNLVSEKTIIDDCYPMSDSYLGEDAAEGHYWYIKGEIYLYDIYLSAYTGAADAYSKTVSIPLTITAGSHGVIQLQDVKPNKYLYYYYDKNNSKKPLAKDKKYVINNITYQVNDSISYWDWLQLSSEDQQLFVDTTYVAVAAFKAGNENFAKDTVVDRTTYDALTASYDSVLHVAKNKNVLLTDVLRMSNSMSHNKGYALTLDLNNPDVWNKYYTHPDSAKKTTGKHPETYLQAPTYRAKQDGIFGRHEYEVGDIITQDVYTTNQQLRDQHARLIGADSAVFELAYVMSEDWSRVDGEKVRYFNKGLVMPKSDYIANSIQTRADTAYFCIDTWKLETDSLLDEYIFYGTSITRKEITDLGRLYGLTDNQINKAIDTHFAVAYYCKTAGKYGGNFYEKDHNYLTKTAWSAMNPEDRQYFEFNYDAFDILIDSTFSGATLKYDGIDVTQPGIYSGEQHIDYTAKFESTSAVPYIKYDGTEASLEPGMEPLTREQYESLPNEQYHYSPIMVGKADSTYYVVNQSFTMGNTSYSVGNVISPTTFGSLGSNQSHIDQLTDFPFENTKYYYCRHQYTIGESGTETGAVTTVTDALGRTEYAVSNNSVVPQGLIIVDTTYNRLPNVQSHFSIHGKTPVGVSTLYVSAQSNILDLSKGRIYTVTYTYDYEESDDEGKNINQVSEKHVVNIHVNFQGGTPTIAPIGNLPTVLPGSTVGVNTPRVTPGAYEVIGGGWEIFASQQDADNHVNGAAFENGNTVLYWYNDDYYLAYYAKTYLGKTYSNAVPFKVGNYHDLSRVMKDTLYHMHVDHPNVRRNSKIYISNNKYDKDTLRNELDLLREFFDLSTVKLKYDSNNNPDTIKDGMLKGHIPLNDHVRNSKNIDFILKTDIAPLSAWTSIGNDTLCFQGKLHGDGHTISGLTSSLFSNLCDSVYNLGVTGSFASSGIADEGGYAQNCWVMTSSDADLSDIKAVMGTGKAVNCYYPTTNAYKTSEANARSLTAFHNGEVAYDLNGFYLAKRNGTDTNKYYYTIADNNNNILNKDSLPNDYVKQNDYVSRRYIDGDFVYAIGSIPEQSNERLYYKEPESETAEPDPKNKKYFPIYPDDYIFFGQMLTYGYSSITGEAYQQYPSSINRTDRSSVGTQNYATQWIVREEANSSGKLKSNRVYRAPAYYGDKQMSKAHFNAKAILPATTSNSQETVYPGMTALDLTGYNDTENILDYNYLTGFQSNGQTRNLLVYTDFYDNSNDRLKTYFADQAPEFPNPDDHENYNRILVLDNDLAALVKGHLVNWLNNAYQAATSHYLVDREDFNAPIGYTFGQGTAMWYQRRPGRYVNSTNSGWETISLPFTAEVVTTQDKGEITHFYENNTTNHEYWLRQYQSVDATDNTIKAMFSAPAAASNYTKEYANTFLYDYYYGYNSGQDANRDTYYQTYYNTEHDYEGYPLYAAGTPYIIGFPGKRYYEFDLSGEFVAMNALDNPEPLEQQVISFVSAFDGSAQINVTDDEIAAAIAAATNDGYIFTPNYKNQTVNAYMLNSTGDKFVRNTSAQAVPFRAYMDTVPKTQQQQQGGAQRRAGTRADVLYIGYLGNSDPLVEAPVLRGLNIYGEHMTIIVENTMTDPANVTVTTAAGKLLKKFTLLPGTKATLPVNNRGIYIVNHQKVAVTR